MTTRYPVLCPSCTRYHGDGTCDSFPDAIPQTIIILGYDHREPIDTELPFELDPDNPKAYEIWMRWSPYGPQEKPG
jgi:hypothetical protein